MGREDLCGSLGNHLLSLDPSTTYPPLRPFLQKDLLRLIRNLFLSVYTSK